MKKIILSAFVFVVAIGCATAQHSVRKVENPSSFETAMLANIQQLDTAYAASTFIALANNFERIGNVEKEKWEPFYYAAYSYTVLAFISPDKNMIDPLSDKAEVYLKKAEALEKNNSEISCLFAMINSCRITVDPISRFQTKRKEVAQLLAKATEENADNPRIYLLQARILLRAPEVFGGGKKPARAAAETAVAKYASFKTDDPIAPSWGEGQAKSLLEKINAN